MVRPFQIYVAILTILTLPIIYFYSVRLSIFSPVPNWWLIYYTIFCSGPALLIYALWLRSSTNEKILSLVTFSIGAIWIISEIVIFAKDIFFNKVSF